MAVWLRRVALTTVSIALIVPLFVAATPPLLDDPNELARSASFASDFGINPIVSLLAQIVPPPLAGKFYLALALLLPLLGTVALHDAIFDKRSWWPLASAIVVYNAALLGGLMDFMIGIGTALLGTASWVSLREKPLRQGAAGAAMAAIVLFIHSFAAAFFLLMIAAFEWRAYRSEAGTRKLRHHALKLGLTALPAASLCVRTLLDHEPTSPIRFAKGIWWTLAKSDPLHEVIGAAASFFTYDTGSDLLILIAVVAAFAALALARKLSFAWPIAIGLGLMLTYLSIPSIASGRIDIRLPVLAGFLFFAGITPRRLGRRETAVLGLAFAALIVVRLGVITLAWQGQNADLADIAGLVPPVKAQAPLVAVIAPKTASEPMRRYRIEPLTAQLN